ncbi:histidine kinase N-terminal 7TM domain-containing protein [Butyrivibrio sp. XPD2006]|uniref:histidine kinase N-terminal 7TM domain-containing protein n=1 Tax=Butyrivibrio sp. XPD2006 TaxID=1280668 RepID=UPI0003B6AC81|nr:histidine kinase N-terminal 7TM domain-containing protein [Butyrivibrio sp. XPD2006]
MSGIKLIKTDDYAIYVMTAIYLLAILSRYTPADFMTNDLSIFLCFVACVVWIVYIKARIVVGRQRLLLCLIALLLMLLHFTQLCKYTIFSGAEVYERRMWYAYYIPTTVVPLLSLYISVLTGKASTEKIPVYLKLLLVPALLQIVLFMTNDYHQLAFSFGDGFANWNKDYGHGILFYINMAWTYLLMLISFIIILDKGFRKRLRRGTAIGSFIAVCHYALTLVLFVNTSDNLKVFGTVPITMPMLYSMTFVMFWETMIHFKLFPSSSGYAEIFNIADISAVIKAKRGKATLESKNKIITDSEDIKQHSKNIMGGTIYWSEDISRINALNRTLKEVGDELRESNALLIEEAEIKARSAKLKVKNDIYDEIVCYMKPHFGIIEKSLKGSEDLTEEEFRERLIISCFEACFIKRGANLLLAVKSGEDIKKRDFSIAVSELFNFAKMAGIKCGIRICDYGKLTNEKMIDIYEYSHKALFDAFETGSEVKVLWN